MKKFSFRFMAQLVAGLALTIIVTPPASANYGCPGGGRGAASPSTAPPVVRPIAPPPPSTYVPGGLPGFGWGPASSIPKASPPPTATRGLTWDEKKKLEGQKYYLIDLINKMEGLKKQLIAENRALDAEISALKQEIHDVEQGFPGRKLSTLKSNLTATQSKRDNNFNSIERYVRNAQVKQSQIDAINRQLGIN